LREKEEVSFVDLWKAECRKQKENLHFSAEGIETGKGRREGVILQEREEQERATYIFRHSHHL
jgi:hypothetical protein